MHIAISSRIAEQMRSIGVPPERLREIPNGIDIGRFPFVESMSLGECKTFIYLGRLEAEKQPMMLLRSFAAALANGVRHRLIIVGDGSLLDDMRSYAHEHRAEDRVQFLGRVEDVGPLIAQAHFFVLTSKIEGMSNALLETMSSGLVPISSAVSGSTDTIRDKENGFLFPRDDESALAACLRHAANMRDAEWQAMRRAARRTIEDGYVMAGIAKRYVDMYENVCRASRRPT